MVVQGHAQEKKLIVAAKAVASSTAQLLIVCKVKADTRSENSRRLQVREGGKEEKREGREDSHVHVCQQKTLLRSGVRVRVWDREQRKIKRSAYEPHPQQKY